MTTYNINIDNRINITVDGDNEPVIEKTEIINPEAPICNSERKDYSFTINNDTNIDFEVEESDSLAQLVSKGLYSFSKNDYQAAFKIKSEAANIELESFSGAGIFRIESLNPNPSLVIRINLDGEEFNLASPENFLEIPSDFSNAVITLLSA